MNAMTAVDQRDDALVASGNLLLSGFTGVQIIFHTFGNPDHYLATLGAMIDGIQSSGIRARIILAITDQCEFIPERLRDFPFPPFVNPGERMKPSQFEEVVVEALRRFPRLHFGVGPVAAQWCSDSMMERIGEIAVKKDLRIHTHLLESNMQRGWIKESPLVRLRRFGLLNSRASFAHAIWLTSDELAEVKNSGAQLVTCPHSNQILRAGTAPIQSWLDLDIPFAIGLDSAAGRESAATVAEMIVDESQAIPILSEGGSTASGLQTSNDEVTWRDWELGIVENLTIDSRTLISDGILHNQEEFDTALQRINATMESDLPARNIRQTQLDGLMSHYLEAITER